MSATNAPMPPTSELFKRKQFVERHGHLLSKNRIDWALRNSGRNGLEAAGAVFRSPCGEDLIHEPAFLRWFLGLTSRNKPRAPRRPRGASASMTA
jgi:hypothetical protein